MKFSCVHLLLPHLVIKPYTFSPNDLSSFLKTWHCPHHLNLFRRSKEMISSYKLQCSFYRATRMHSADYAVARCLSVRPLHAGSVDTSERILKMFCHQVAQSFYFFPYQTRRPYSNGNPLTGASNGRGTKRYHDFRPISRFVSEMMQVTWNDAYSYYRRRIGNRTQAFEW